MRDLKSKLANLQYVFINLLEMPVLALILSSLLFYFQVGKSQPETYVFYENPNIITYIIISVIIALFVGLTVSAEEIINDKKILKREAFLNLSRFSYLLSKVVILGILSAMQTALFVAIGNGILQIKGMFWVYWLMLFSSAAFANLLGLIISDSLKKTVNIYILIPFLIIPQLILSGVFVSYDRLNPNLSSVSNIPWYGELITARWAFEGLAVHQFAENDFQKHFFVYEKLKSTATYRKDYWLPAMSNEVSNLNEISDTIEQKNLIDLLNSELKEVASSLPKKDEFPPLPVFNKRDNTAQQIEDAKKYFKKLKTYFINLYNEADKRQEQLRQEMISNHPQEGGGYLTELKNKFHNEGLERFVRGTDDFFSKRIIRHDQQLIQKFDAIYKEPKHPFLKAHFLAPHKKIGQFEISTLWANLIIIWGMNVILFILLYSKTLKKILSRSKKTLQKR